MTSYAIQLLLMDIDIYIYIDTDPLPEEAPFTLKKNAGLLPVILQVFKRLKFLQCLSVRIANRFKVL